MTIKKRDLIAPSRRIIAPSRRIIAPSRRIIASKLCVEAPRRRKLCVEAPRRRKLRVVALRRRKLCEDGSFASKPREDERRRKNSHHSNKAKKQTKYAFTEYFDIFTLRERPISLASIEKLAQELVQWANLKSSTSFRQFLRLKGLHNEDFNRFCKRSRALQAAKKYAFSALADDRELKALNRKYEPQTARLGIMRYDKRYRKLIQAAKDRQQDETRPTFVVQVNKTPETDIVPRKNETRDTDKTE